MRQFNSRFLLLVVLLFAMAMGLMAHHYHNTEWDQRIAWNNAVSEWQPKVHSEMHKLTESFLKGFGPIAAIPLLALYIRYLIRKTGSPQCVDDSIWFGPTNDT